MINRATYSAPPSNILAIVGHILANHSFSSRLKVIWRQQYVVKLILSQLK